jgi:hypothetical protein
MLFSMVQKQTFGEPPIVGMVVEDSNSKGSSIGFESTFSK